MLSRLLGDDGGLERREAAAAVLTWSVQAPESQLAGPGLKLAKRVGRQLSCVGR